MRNGKNRLAALLVLAMLLGMGSGIAIAEVAKTENVELIYTPGEDLLIAEWDGVKIWITGEQERMFAANVFDEYVLFRVKLQNDTDRDVMIMFCGSINGASIYRPDSFVGAEASKESSSYFDIVAFPEEFSEINGLDVSLAQEALAARGDVTLEIKVCSQDASGHVEILCALEPVVIRFGERNDETQSMAAAEADEAELLYTPDMDLLLLDTGEVRVKLYAEKDPGFGELVEADDSGKAYRWYSLGIDNESDQMVALEYELIVDGYNCCSREIHVGIHTQKGTDWLPNVTDEDKFYICSLYIPDEDRFFEMNPDADEATLKAIIHSPKVLQLNLQLFSDENEKHTNLLSIAQKSVTVHFAGNAAETAEAAPAVEEAGGAVAEGDAVDVAEVSGEVDLTVEDFVGTWYLNRAYLADRGYTVDVTTSFEWDPYEYMIVIEPGKVTITNGDSKPSVFEGELNVVNDTLFVMIDEESYYTNSVFSLVDTDDGRMLADPLTSGDVSFYTNEVPNGPGKVHKDKAMVKAAQQALNDAGYDCGRPDGAAGKKTRAAITAYQTDKGLTVTGTVTDELLRSLGVQ